MQAATNIVSLVEGWENATDTKLLFPVAYDWRRDFWDESQRIYDMVLHAHSETGCKPILVGLSFGGLLTYTAFTRFREQLADKVHGVLYAVAPMQPSAAAIGRAPL
jgi:pimeloyl-ACP methyl ester carboxylesterase